MARAKQISLDNTLIDLGAPPSSSTPVMNGTAAVGTETSFARGDHVHPTDTSRQATITGAATTVTSNNLTASRALISNSSGKIAVSDITSTELGYLDDVTSNIQTQLNSKLDKRLSDVSAALMTDGNGYVVASQTTAAQLEALRTLDTTSTIQTQIDGKAPTNHQSTGTSYGVGTSAAYGHLKIANNLSTDSFNASAPVALSAYQGKLLNDNKLGVNAKAASANTADTATNASGNTFTITGTSTSQLKLATTNYSNGIVRARDTENTGGCIMQIQSGGNLIIGSGEFANNLYDNDLDSSSNATGESLYLGSDGTTRIYSNGNTIDNRKTWHYDTAGAINLPDGTAKITQDGNILLNTSTVTGWLSTVISNITPSRTNNSSTGKAETSITKNTQTNAGSFTLAKGTYIVTVSARWNSNATGARQVWLSTTSTGGTMDYNSMSSIQAANGAVTQQQITCLLEPTASTTFYIVVNHTSTSSVNCTTRYSIIKLSSG